MHEQTPAPDDAPNIVLTGFMGTGKSTVGRLLAGRMAMDFVDTDHLIEERHGPIADIFATAGEDAFRSMEREISVELGARSGHVISTGGRLLLDPANAAALQNNGRVFCLAADVDEILARVLPPGQATTRPLLVGDNPRERIAALLEERQDGYAAFEQVSTNGRTPNAVADDIAARLHQD